MRVLLLCFVCRSFTFLGINGIDFFIAGTLRIESRMIKEVKWKFYLTVWKNYMVWLVFCYITLNHAHSKILSVCRVSILYYTHGTKLSYGHYAEN